MRTEQTEQERDKREQRSATATSQKRVDRVSPEVGPQRLLGQNSHSCPVSTNEREQRLVSAPANESLDQSYLYYCKVGSIETLRAPTNHGADSKS